MEIMESYCHTNFSQKFRENNFFKNKFLGIYSLWIDFTEYFLGDSKSLIFPHCLIGTKQKLTYGSNHLLVPSIRIQRRWYWVLLAKYNNFVIFLSQLCRLISKLDYLPTAIGWQGVARVSLEHQIISKHA